MTPQEAALVFGAVKALCPAQKMEELSPDMWFRVLRRFPFKDAENAVIELAETCRFIAPADIIAVLKRKRISRWEKLPIPCPNTVPGVTEGDEIRALERAICDGEYTTRGQLAAYEKWGGSLHLAYQRGGRLPELTGPEPGNTGPLELEAFFPAVAPLTRRELTEGNR